MPGAAEADVVSGRGTAAACAADTGERTRRALAAAGDWLGRNRRAVRRLQWTVVAVYAVLLLGPVFAPLPESAARIWDDVVLLAQFAFWGVWWPAVLLSMVLVGRAWCGLFCPEGALSEFASARGRGRALPRWIKWPGWPFVAFVATTVYGQMVSVYQYPGPALVVLGGSTVAAVVVGLAFGRHKRVWCRYLCPVSGVFAVLAKLAPIHFRVDRAAWNAADTRPAGSLDCAPMVPVRTMSGASACHMCGRCSGYRGAVTLAPRAPNREIVEHGANDARPWHSALIVFGLMGVAPGAFHWASSPWFVEAKLWLARRLIETGQVWPLEATAPWWILTNRPEANDVLSLLDGALLLAYVAATALLWGGTLAALVAGAARALGPWARARFHHLVQALIPLAGCGVFLGLSALSVTMLRAEGLILPWVDGARAAMLAGATLWSLWLAWRIAGRYAHRLRRALSTAFMAATAAVGAAAWVLLFWIW